MEEELYLNKMENKLKENGLMEFCKNDFKYFTYTFLFFNVILLGILLKI